MGDKYSSDRKNPSVAQCGQVSIAFNGKVLTMTGTKVYTYHAVSGRGDGKGNFPLDTASQSKKDVGPIPEGRFWITPSEMVTNGWSHPFMSSSAWGNHRMVIHPFPSTGTYDRGGMFIHGGDTPGSAGCVDLWDAMDTFVEDLNREVGTNTDCMIPLKVQYGDGPGDYNMPAAGQATT